MMAARQPARTAPQPPAPAALACLRRPTAALQPRHDSLAGLPAAALPAGGSGGALSGRQAVAAAGARAWPVASGVRLGGRLQLRTTAWAAGAIASSGSGGGSEANDKAVAASQKRGRPLTPVPDVDAEQLLHSLGLSGAADPAVLLKRLRKLPGVRQQGVLDNATAVAAHLRSPAVGLTAQQVGQLLQRCPELFSWPAEQRAAVLFGELMAAGLTAAGVVQCLVLYPAAAKCTTFAPGLAEAAAILAHSEDRNSMVGPMAKVPAAQRTVAALLSSNPGAMLLVCQRAGYLQKRAAQLQQLGLTAAEVAALAWRRPEVLSTDAAARVASRAAVVQQELGLPAAEVIALVVKCKPTWLASSITTVQERAAALAEGFGRAAAPGMLLKSPLALNCDPIVWRRNLCYMAACGVANPSAVLRQHPLLLPVDQAAPLFLQRRLLLQQAFGLTAVQLYEQHRLRLLHLAPTELVQRLQLVQHCGQTHRLVAKAARGRKPEAPSAEERRPVLSLRAVTGTLEEFLAAVGASQAEWEAWAAANPPEACPLYGWAQQAAAEEAAQLAAALPAELAGWERRQHRFSGANARPPPETLQLLVP